MNTEMAFQLTVSCNLDYGLLKCHLPSDTVDVDLKVRTMKGVHVYRKDYKSQVNKCIPWGVEVRPYPEIKIKMADYLK